MKTTIVTYIHGLLFRKKDLTSRQRWILGLIDLALVVVLWVLLSFLVNTLADDYDYSKPFFLTYINTSLFALYLIPYLHSEDITIKEFIHDLWSAITKGRRQRTHSRSPLHLVPIRRLLSPEYGSQEEESISENTAVVVKPSATVGFSQTIWLLFQFALLWFLANLVTNASLSYTLVASQTILSLTLLFFTLLIGYLYKVERINRYKLAGILLSFIGVLIVTEVDAQDDTNRHHEPVVILFGNMLALTGAVIYGVYTILLKLKTTISGTTEERELNTHLFFGFVGVFTLFMLWPILILLDLSGFETFELPPTLTIASILLGNTFITFISDFCWCKAVLLTSPLTVTVGLLMTIPLAMVGDWIFKLFAFNWWYMCGACVVTLGFLIINRDEEADFVQEDRD